MISLTQAVQALCATPEHPLLVMTSLVPPIRADRKTVTRRLVDVGRLGPSVWTHGSIGAAEALDGDRWRFRISNANVWSNPTRCPYGAPGHHLWVRETWAPHDECAMRERDRSMVYYLADDPERHDTDGRWRPSIHMPRWASRILLKVTDVRVERIQAITTEEIIAEGFSTHLREHDAECHLRDQFVKAWDGKNPKGGRAWQANPWVWVVSFRRLHG